MQELENAKADVTSTDSGSVSGALREMQQQGCPMTCAQMTQLLTQLTQQRSSEEASAPASAPTAAPAPATNLVDADDAAIQDVWAAMHAAGC
jgi:hypothetical protein